MTNQTFQDKYIDQIICGDALKVMRSMPDECVQTCVTSPPYWGLRDYGLDPISWDGDPECDHEWGGESRHPHISNTRISGDHARDCTCNSCSGDFKKSLMAGSFCHKCNAWLGCLGLEPSPELYVDHLVQIFREVKRALRKDGTLWLNVGDSYAGGNRGGNPDDSPFRKQATNKGSLVAPTPIPPGSVLKPKDMVLIPFRLVLALQSDGWWVRSDIIWHKPNVMPSSVKDRPTTDFEHVFLLAKSKKYYYDGDAIREEAVTKNMPGTNFTDTRKTHGVGGGNTGIACAMAKIRSGELKGRNKRTVWKIPTKSYAGAHFATFPPKLIEPMILAGSSDKACEHCGAVWVRVVERTPANGAHPQRGVDHRDGRKGTVGVMGFSSAETTGFEPSCDCPDNNGTGASVVFDPFAGSGTTCAVAKAHGRHWIGIEANAEYCKLAEKRIRDTAQQFRLDLTQNGGAK